MLDKHYDSGPAPDEPSLSPLPHRPRGHLRDDAENRKARGWGRAGQVVFWTRRGQGVHELTAVEISRLRFAQDQHRSNPSGDGIDNLQAPPRTGELFE